MKTGEPITPIQNEKGHRIADMSTYEGRAWVEFSACAGKFDKNALQGIIDLMNKAELDLFQVKK